ncbi:Protein of unknown function [Paenibacillus sp. UNC496MF]|uniref:glycoside hydrolase family 172 protein n=1 Tax=Paenibacillus sp. UNC496MF TaxID=1502753 RepID=UPI0008E183A1|nr:glycoside hydrolase family 172 protein [Paenibacillus sp. UNC496MF]SFJ55057.1 Protein of unknown function [Paenibacillus sp. UNC496MF]
MFPPLYEIRKANTRQFTTFDPATKSKTVRIMSGEPPRTIVKSDKPGIINRMWLTFPGWFWRHWDTQAENETSTLKKLIIRIYWDGESQPSVECPIGDFFGIGHCEFRHFVSRYIGMSSGGFYSYFPMPYNQVRIELENLHERIPLDVFFNANYEEYAELPKDSGRFHCLFRTDRLGGSDPLPLVDIQGRGHYIGCCLSMQGEDLNYLSYLEAPEYMFIDTEDRDNPTIVGTGLEDYFNGGWYFRDGEFYAELHGVPLKDTLRSMISMYRFHERDAVAFEKNLSISFVNPWESKHLKPYWFSSTAYWYQDQAAPLPDKLPVDKLMSMYRRRDTDHQSYP